MTFAAAAGFAPSLAAQTATVHLKSGEKIVYSADELDFIEFNEGEAIDENENILTAAMIPDDVLRDFINTECAHSMGVFTVKQAAAYNKPMDLSETTGITSLKGLEFFKSLESLNISYLTSLDIATLPTLKSLTSLKCAHLTMNPSNINFAKLYPNLTQLTVSYDDVNGPWTIVNDKLTDLICDGCGITSLDVSKCPNLRQLVCSSNQLTSINISGCPYIEELYVQYNSSLGSLDLTGIGSQLIGLNVAQTGIRDLDISECVNLVDLELQDNYMTGRVLDFTACTHLSHLRCENAGLAGIKVAGLTMLNDLNCYNNQLTNLDLTGCSALTLVNAFNNSITDISIAGCSSISQLNISNNQLQTVDVTPTQAHLGVFGANNNKLTEIKGLELCAALTDVNINQNMLSELVIANATALREFQCSNNQLTSIEFINCPSLLNMDLYGNQLSRVDLTGMSIDVFPTGMFFYDGNKSDLQLKVWPEFDLDNKPGKWYGTATFVYEFTNE